MQTSVLIEASSESGKSSPPIEELYLPLWYRAQPTSAKNEPPHSGQIRSAAILREKPRSSILLADGAVSAGGANKPFFLRVNQTRRLSKNRTLSLPKRT